MVVKYSDGYENTGTVMRKWDVYEQDWMITEIMERVWKSCDDGDNSRMITKIIGWL